MDIFIEQQARVVSRRVAEWVADEIRKQPSIVLGLATGRTPLGVYQQWCEQVRADELSFADVTTFNLDEYRGLAPWHPQSYRTYMQEHLFQHIDIDPSRTYIPQGNVADVEAHCRAYDQQIAAAGGIDLQLLGIGRNGHIGFNEPGESVERDTHLVTLTESTRRANASFFTSLEDVPTQAITMGLRSILRAKRIVLMAVGEEKSAAVREAILGDVSEQCPASLLQPHPACVFWLDEAAASQLPSELRKGRRERTR